MASISSLSGVLEQAGFTVEVLVESTPRSMQEIEADRADRIKERQGRLSDKADRLASAANAQFAKADQHLGGGGYKGFTRSMDAGVTAQRESEDAARRATASEHNEAHRESAPATIRRIERLETEQRDIERKLTPCATSGRKLKTGNEGKSFTCPGCYTKQTVGDDLAVPRHGGAEGAYAERLTARQAELNGEVSYWRRHLASLEAQGVKLWGKGDFAKGDMAQTSHGWHKVVRANAKSLTVETGYSWTETLAYDRVIGKRRPESE
jgi:hypothetical protein